MMKNAIIDPKFLHKNREIIRAAQSLVNDEMHNNSSTLITGKKSRHNIGHGHKLEKFERAIKSSEILSSEEKHTFSLMGKNEKFQLAREIVLSLLNKELKSPLKKE